MEDSFYGSSEARTNLTNLQSDINGKKTTARSSPSAKLQSQRTLITFMEMIYPNSALFLRGLPLPKTFLFASSLLMQLREGWIGGVSGRFDDDLACLADGTAYKLTGANVLEGIRRD